ncbi:hypothetical protein AX16_010222 [Volvariella volvacea WC 439]|nr:hypothetical protein AX16_010222 [Volvariella volvacea WC 439]
MPYTSPETKAQVVAYKSQGLTNRPIAALLGIHPSTVSRICRRYQNAKTAEDYEHVEPKTGRPSKLTARDVRRATRLLSSGKAENATDLQRKFFPGVSAQAIRSMLAKAGWEAYSCGKDGLPVAVNSNKTRSRPQKTLPQQTKSKKPKKTK